jgi:hypothetical protein
MTSSIILSPTLRDLASTLGCASHQVESVVREERSARAALDRRGFFRASGAVAAGVVMPLPVATPTLAYRPFKVFVNGVQWATGYDWSAVSRDGARYGSKELIRSVVADYAEGRTP